MGTASTNSAFSTSGSESKETTLAPGSRSSRSSEHLSDDPVEVGCRLLVKGSGNVIGAAWPRSSVSVSSSGSFADDLGARDAQLTNRAGLQLDGVCCRFSGRSFLLSVQAVRSRQRLSRARRRRGAYRRAARQRSSGRHHRDKRARLRRQPGPPSRYCAERSLLDISLEGPALIRAAIPRMSRSRASRASVAPVGQLVRLDRRNVKPTSQVATTSATTANDGAILRRHHSTLR